MACEICKDKISSELENIIGKDRVEFIKKHSSKDRVISKGGFFGFEKQLDICSICTDAINYFGGPRLKYEHLDDDSDDPTIRLGKYHDGEALSLFKRFNSTKMQKFLKSKKRLIGNTKNVYPGYNLYLDNPKYFFDNINTIYNDIIDYYKVEHK